MWSLTPQRERRTSGPENFQSSTKKDFFNTIHSEADIARQISHVRKVHKKPKLSPVIQATRC
jgi:hypothetical protein